MQRFLLAGLTLFGLAFAGSAQDKKDKDEPKKADLPVKATLTAKKTEYKLELGGKSAEEYQTMIRDGEKMGRLPPPPAVELALELKNTSDKDVQVWVSGDPVVLTLELKGKGAVNAQPKVALTTDFRGPAAMTLAPGKTHVIPITSLRHGFRNVSLLSYWTEPGEYTLTGKFKTGIAPAPKGVKEMRDGFGVVTLEAEPIKLKVVAK